MSKRDPTEIRAKEMSTVRIHHGELHVTILFTGPKGGGRGMMRLDSTEAHKLLRSLARACAAMEEQRNAISLKKRVAVVK